MTDKPDQPDQPIESPITVLAAGAAQLHELFQAYLGAGFTEDQALRILIGILRSPTP